MRQPQRAFVVGHPSTAEHPGGSATAPTQDAQGHQPGSAANLALLDPSRGEAVSPAVERGDCPAVRGQELKDVQIAKRVLEQPVHEDNTAAPDAKGRRDTVEVGNLALASHAWRFFTRPRSLPLPACLPVHAAPRFHLLLLHSLLLSSTAAFHLPCLTASLAD
eukprot:scaffold238724_cov31-Tisochrysis_lutea.AAC.1